MTVRFSVLAQLLAISLAILPMGCSSDASSVVDDPATPDDPGAPMIPPGLGDTPPINLVNCERGVENVRGNALETASHGDVEYVVGGFEIADGDHDPFVARIDGGSLSWCAVYSQETTDERGGLVAVAGDGSLWVVFHTSNSGTELVASEGAFQPEAGSGEGKEIAFLANLDPEDGIVLAATFVHAVGVNGEANSMEALALSITSDDQPELVALAEATPPPFQSDQCDPPSPHQWKGEFSRDLTTLIEVSADRCRLE